MPERKKEEYPTTFVLSFPGDLSWAFEKKLNARGFAEISSGGGSVDFEVPKRYRPMKKLRKLLCDTILGLCVAARI